MSVVTQKKEALDISIKQGSASTAAFNLGDSYITPLVLALKASAFDVGVLNAVTGLFGPLAQIWGSKKEYNTSRKSIQILFENLQALLWIPIAVIAIYSFFTGSSEKLVYSSILIYLVLYIFANAEYPSWFSWMGDLVSEKIRGRYFGKRNAINGAIGLAVIIIGSITLDKFKAAGYLMVAFAVLFALSAIMRLISAYYVRKQYEPVNTQKEEKKESFTKFIKEKSSLSRFAWILMIFNFAVMISSPFTAVYMLKNLSFSYFIYTIVIMSNTGFYLLFTPLIGKIADRYGSTPLLKISSWFFAATPLLWMISKNPLILIFVPQLVSGLANATLTTATTNYSYEAITEKKRGQYISYINVLVGIGVLIGSLIGGTLLEWLPQSTNIFFTVFIISAITRALVALFIMPRVISGKIKQKMPNISVNLSHPLKTLHTDINFVRHITK
jgi:MFS family permease